MLVAMLLKVVDIVVIVVLVVVELVAVVVVVVTVVVVFVVVVVVTVVVDVVTVVVEVVLVVLVVVLFVVVNVVVDSWYCTARLTHLMTSKLSMVHATPMPESNPNPFLKWVSSVWASTWPPTCITGGSDSTNMPLHRAGLAGRVRSS